jgi:3',5'-cyclic-AMP phosphodiesterase
MGSPLRITQFSDTHFSTSGERSHGGFGYDTDAAWDSVWTHAFGDGQLPDLVVVTGDIADHGQPDEYVKAAEQLARIPVHANVCIGNHDTHVAFEAGLPRPGLTMSRTLRLGNWLFVFADSNFAGREVGPHGRLCDRDDRIEGNGGLGPNEAAWIAETVAATDAAHAFIWVHHPPCVPGHMSAPHYDEEIAHLLRMQPKLRGIGAGHTHTDTEIELVDRPVFTCPAFTINLDFTARTLLPPGYRTYEFHDDGTVTSVCHLLDDPRWPRHKLPRAAAQWLMGEISWDEMQVALASLRGG